MGSLEVGTCDADAGQWQIKRPYRLFVEQATLNHVVVAEALRRD